MAATYALNSYSVWTSSVHIPPKLLFSSIFLLQLILQKDQLSRHKVLGPQTHPRVQQPRLVITLVKRHESFRNIISGSPDHGILCACTQMHLTDGQRACLNHLLVVD